MLKWSDYITLKKLVVGSIWNYEYVILCQTTTDPMYASRWCVRVCMCACLSVCVLYKPTLYVRMY